MLGLSSAEKSEKRAADSPPAFVPNAQRSSSAAPAVIPQTLPASTSMMNAHAEGAAGRHARRDDLSSPATPEISSKPTEGREGGGAERGKQRRLHADVSERDELERTTEGNLIQSRMY